VGDLLQVREHSGLETAAESQAISGGTGRARSHPALGGVLRSLATVPDHELIRQIGSGAYGEVWLARSVMGTYRAVKVVFRRQFEEDRPYEREFNGIRKFEPLSRSQEGLVDVLQVGRNEQARYFYYVMELADPVAAPAVEDNQATTGTSAKEPLATVRSATCGLDPAGYSPRTLRAEMIAKGRLPVEECISLGLTLAAALEHLHLNGLVHRDIKPSNIIFVKGVPKLADIGLVADMNEAKSLVGTLGYLPPEGSGTPAADLYSLGKVLYEAATGRDREDFPQLPVDLHLMPEAAKLIEFNEVLLKACEPDSKKRYPSAAQMGRELQCLRDGKSLRNARAWRRSGALLRRASPVLISIALCGAAIALIPGGRVQQELPSRDPEVNILVDRADDICRDNIPDRLATAVDFYQEAIDRDRTYVPAYVGMLGARLLQASGFGPKDTNAIQNLHIAITNLMRAAPRAAETLVAMSFLDLHDGNWGKAMARAKEATKAKPATKEGLGFAHEIYGGYLMRLGDHEESLRHFETAERLNRADPTVLLQLGNHYYAVHNFEKALEYYNRCIKQRKEQSLPYFCMGKIYQEQGQFLKAVEQFEIADKYRGKSPAEIKESYDDLKNAAASGATQYWGMRLDKAIKAGRDDENIAFILAHIPGKMEEAFNRLDRACDTKKLDDLWFEPVWDHNDPRFKMIAKKYATRGSMNDAR
jgi:serine/threonine protein kinase